MGIVMVMLVMALCSGCVSSLVAYRTNNEHIKNVVQLKQVGNGTFLGVDLMGITTAYLTAWQEHPVMMTGATATDLGIGYLMYDQGFRAGQDSKTESSAAALPQTVSGEVVVIGNQNTVEYVRDNQ